MRWRMFAGERHHLSQIDDAFTIQVQPFDGDTSGWCQADEQCAVGVPGEVLMPVVFARMIERNGLPGGWINRASFVVLGAVTTLTRKRQIVFGAAAPGDEGNDMVNGKSFGRTSFLAQAGFATAAGAFSDQKLRFARESLPNHAGGA